MAAELTEHPKERAEHVMLVDLARNDVGRVAEFGTVHVDELMTLERYSHVMHLTSQVSGALRDGLGPIDVLRATLPAGTVSGAPKVRARAPRSPRTSSRPSARNVSPPTSTPASSVSWTCCPGARAARS